MRCFALCTTFVIDESSGYPSYNIIFKFLFKKPNENDRSEVLEYKYHIDRRQKLFYLLYNNNEFYKIDNFYYGILQISSCGTQPFDQLDV